jgi:mRNA interferase RelE/StbE|tara:strand:- start:723 stop:977 length:255 start_codon:yes stop_codon:yes gene_type:complete
MYEIIFSNEAKKQLSKLSGLQKNRIGNALERIRIRPHKFIRRLYNSRYYRLRVDHFRVILDLRDMQLVIYVIEIGKRGEVYRRY